MKLALIFNRLSPFNAAGAIEDIIKKAGIYCEYFPADEADKIEDKFDLYFRVDHGDYKYDISPHLKPAVFYAIDTHLKKPYRKIKEQAAHYDVVFCAQKEGAQRLRKETGLDCQWVPLAADPRFNKRCDMPKKFDIGFVGRDAKKFSRGKHLKLLKKNYPNSFIGQAPFEEMNKIYSASRIGFNSSISDDINRRIFEIMACGCFLLTSHIKGESLKSLFIDRKHLVVYRDEEEMLELIDYYLKYEDQREAIAKAGYELVTSAHTFYHRVQRMFNYLAFKFGGKFNKLKI
jgi:spore maturation protein CgeB